MDKKNILLILAVIVIIIIIIDLCFNFSKILQENFTQNESLPKSIVSKKDGRIININYLSTKISQQSDDEYDIFLQSPLSNNKNIVLNSDGTLSENFARESDIYQRWKLIKIDSANRFLKFLENNKLGLKTNISCVDYPFYIVKPNSNKNRALQYEYGSLSCRPIGNYDSQKWDVSNETYDGKSILIHNVSNSSNDMNFRKNPDVNDRETDPNKINFNLKINNDLLKEILNKEQVEEQQSSQKQCGFDVPNDAIKSLCPSCSPDLF